MFARENLTRRLGTIATLPLLALLVGLVLAGPAHAEFSVTSFSNEARDASGQQDTRAGGHPASLVTEVQFNLAPGPVAKPTENLKNLQVNFPTGFIGDPRAVPECAQPSLDEGLCPRDTQVGIVAIQQAIGGGAPFTLTLYFPIYNVVPPLGQPAVVGFVPGLFPVNSRIFVRSESDYGISYELQNIPEPTDVTGTIVTLWGVPSASSHDSERSRVCSEIPAIPQFPKQCTPVNEGPGPVTIPHKPFLTNPTSCEGKPLVTTATVATWQHPETFVQSRSETAPVQGCDQLHFDADLKARPTTDVADSPSGLDVNLEVPQHPDLDGVGLATPHLRDAVVTLPPGLVVNPASANGLEACSPSQIGLVTAVGDHDPQFNTAKPTCPSGAEIGSVEVQVPAFEDPLKGRVLLATPHENPFGSLVALYLYVEGHGVTIKLAGEARLDPSTGQLTTSFADDPQQPVESLRLKLFSGAVAPLRTPATCGTYATTSTLTPWSSPQSGGPVTPRDEYAITRSPGGGPCATSEGALPKDTAFEAGTASAVAGNYSPFVLKLSRGDGTQQLAGIDATLPPGLLAKLAGVPYCSDGDLAAAASKSGRAEQASPSCPGASQVGTVTVAAGAGPKPFYAPGKAYLAGPYKGAPLSLAVVVPAVAGPFDVGTVVVRNALYVDPTSAQVHAVSDPFPTILQGIPLDVRSVEVELSKSEFTKNPTSCNASSVSGAASLLTGQSASLSAHFQVGECGRLKFSPSLKLSLSGQTKRTGHPAVKAVLTAPEGQANLAAATVILPRSEFIDQGHVNNPCTRVQFNENACPPKSVLGTAVAWSPLLEKPLEGPVYFRSNGGERKLPDIVADLNGQIHVVLVGFIDSVKVGKAGSRVRTRFLNVPDAPVSKFVLQLKGGKQGLIENSKNLCKVKPVADLKLTGQNAKTANSESPIATSCKKRKAKAKKHRGAKGGGKGKKGGHKGNRG